MSLPASSKLDAIDRRILETLQKQGRLSNQDLSERRARAVAEVVRAVRQDLELGCASHELN